MASQSQSSKLVSWKMLMPMVALILLRLARPTLCDRRDLELDDTPVPENLTYHGGPVLHGDIPVYIVWYGAFTPEQKAIVVDFVESLTSKPAAMTPSVSLWWTTLYKAYMSNATADGGDTRVLLDSEVADDKYSLGKTLTLAQVSQLAAGARPKKGGLVLVLTDADVVVEGFCSIRCGQHGADARAGWAYAWTGDAAAQCPGQCAWPFAKPSYGPQDKPLGAPNGDVGVDGLMVTLASMFAGAVTNPFRDAFYQGEKDAALEACTACAGVFGSGSFPGYAGNVLVDKDSGGSYNAVGAGGHKYLLPAIYDPAKAGCSTSV
ncbi:hypothetical protein PR202_ga17709 [Eleusine coracana subsp. coracana]|uniref:Protein EXORDIUM n=1 Tax=Eleusine coracana subsp. coracana TaxID=191504 RepID=A0AAV5CQ45_ELECO|nr:hypothetical protein PR202_ga17462 [Eleusine coracana subsp. coracana]GJN00520.1 hypothetical protein PR202_ga17709 [Eleusine coracana subsp. coracana]